MVHQVDPRNEGRILLTEGWREKTLLDHHREISECQLSDHVPERVAVAYETAKNLALYSWYVYRFVPVSELQATIALEYGLKVFYEVEERNREKVPRKYRGLGNLLRAAVSDGRIRNEGFPIWHQIARGRARVRQLHEASEQMLELGLEQISYDDEDVETKEQDYDWDFADGLCESRDCMLQ